MKTTLKPFLIAALFSMTAFTNLGAQCESHDCNPALNGMEFFSGCIFTENEAILSIDWLMSGGDLSCLAPAGSWNIQISFPTGGEYGVTDNLTVEGAEFDWTYDAANFTLNGTSNIDMIWSQQGTITVTVTGNTDTECALVSSNANIQIIPNILGGCTDAFNNVTADDNKNASLGTELIVTLPVDLVKFTAKRTNESSLLEWTTRVEVNNNRFEIQRSEDGLKFKTIGQVKAQISTAFESNYTYLDESPLKGVNYYRLKQVDHNGSYTLSEVRQVNFDGPSDGAIRFSPNPVVDNILVENLSANSIETIRITDDSNKLIRTIEVDVSQDVHRFDLSGLSSGVYYLRFVGGKKVVTKKLIKISF